MIETFLFGVWTYIDSNSFRYFSFAALNYDQSQLLMLLQYQVMRRYWLHWMDRVAGPPNHPIYEFILVCMEKKHFKSSELIEHVQ